MVRNLTSWCGLLVGLGLALEPAQAGDRKSTDRGHKAGDEMVMSREMRSVALRSNVSDSSSVRLFEARDDEAASAPQRKALTFFTIKSQLGEIAVQPAIGPAKGVQFSLGF